MSTTPELPPIVISVNRAARRMGLGPTKTWEMIRDGELPVVRLGGRTLVRIADIDALLERNLTSAA